MLEEDKIGVLAVDDSAFMQAMFSEMLKESEFEILETAKNGIEAFEKYKKLKPHLVLLDIVMPAETGTQTLKRILGFDQNANIIMVSSLATREKVIECLNKGAKDFLQKPFEDKDLLKVLRNVVKTLKGRRSLDLSGSKGI